MGVDSTTAARDRGGRADGNGRLRLSPAETLLQLWRAKGLMLLIFVLSVIAATAVAFATPKTYAASARLLVSNAALSTAGPDAAERAPLAEEATLRSEVELILSPVIAERVVADLGLARLYPQLAAAQARSTSHDAGEIEVKALTAFSRSLSAEARPGSSVLNLAFRGRDPGIAMEALNSVVRHYLDYRLETLASPDAAALPAQRNDAEQRLLAAEEALRAFLQRQQLTDFEAELGATERLFAGVSEDLFDAEVAARESMGRTSGLQKQLVAAPREIDLFKETASSRDPAQQRKPPDALPESQPPPTLRRSGPNPTRLEIEAGLADAGAATEAQTSRVAELVRQKAEIEARRSRLAAIEPEYRRLVRERDAIRSTAEAYALRTEAGRVQAHLGVAGRGMVSVYQRTQPSADGDLPRRLIVAAGAGLGLLAALALGLLRAVSANAFPTPASIERTMGVAVLAVTSERGA